MYVGYKGDILIQSFFSYPVDLIVCCALGVDMYDCVYPTRTAVSQLL